MAKVNVARQRYQAKQQNNQIVAQLNQLKTAGYSTEDIRKFQQKNAPTSTQPTVAPTTPAGPPQWWQIAQQYGTPATTPASSFRGDIGRAPRPTTAALPAWQQSLLSAYGQQYPPRATATAGRSAAVSSTMIGPQGPMQWWQFAKQYSLPKQPPEAPLDDFYFRHLNETTQPAATTTSGSGSGGGSGGYRRRRGRGGGGGYSYAPRQSYSPDYAENAAPGWALGGLANWSFG